MCVARKVSHIFVYVGSVAFMIWKIGMVWKILRSCDILSFFAITRIHPLCIQSIYIEREGIISVSILSVCCWTMMGCDVMVNLDQINDCWLMFDSSIRSSVVCTEGKLFLFGNQLFSAHTTSIRRFIYFFCLISRLTNTHTRAARDDEGILGSSSEHCCWWWFRCPFFSTPHHISFNPPHLHQGLSTVTCDDDDLLTSYCCFCFVALAHPLVVPA